MELFTNPSAPPIEYEYFSSEHFVYVNNMYRIPPSKKLPQSPKNNFPQPSAPPLDVNIINTNYPSNPDYRIGNKLSIPGYVRPEKKDGNGCCIIF